MVYRTSPLIAPLECPIPTFVLHTNSGPPAKAIGSQSVSVDMPSPFGPRQRGQVGLPLPIEPNGEHWASTKTVELGTINAIRRDLYFTAPSFFDPGYRKGVRLCCDI